MGVPHASPRGRRHAAGTLVAEASNSEPLVDPVASEPVAGHPGRA